MTPYGPSWTICSCSWLNSLKHRGNRLYLAELYWNISTSRFRFATQENSFWNGLANLQWRDDGFELENLKKKLWNYSIYIQKVRILRSTIRIQDVQIKIVEVLYIVTSSPWQIVFRYIIGTYTTAYNSTWFDLISLGVQRTNGQCQKVSECLRLNTALTFILHGPSWLDAMKSKIKSCEFLTEYDDPNIFIQWASLSLMSSGSPKPKFQPTKTVIDI